MIVRHALVVLSSRYLNILVLGRDRGEVGLDDAIASVGLRERLRGAARVSPSIVSNETCW